MAAPSCHVGPGTRREAAAAATTGGEEEEEEEEETETEGEEPGVGALRSVFPRDPALFADVFPVERRYRLCGHVLRIAQHHGPRLGLAASVWEAALSLCRYLEEQRFDFRGRTVIELGAGTGIVGILAALLGGDVTITDQPAALEQIRENVRLNFPPSATVRPQVRSLVWGRDEGSFPREYEVILGSDIVYHPPSFPPLLGTLRHLCGPRSLALLCAKMRGGDGGSRHFFRRMLPPYFRVQLLRREPEEEIEIYRVTCRGGGDPLEEGGVGGAHPVSVSLGEGCPQAGGALRGIKRSPGASAPPAVSDFGGGGGGCQAGGGEQLAKAGGGSGGGLGGLSEGPGGAG